MNVIRANVPFVNRCGTGCRRGLRWLTVCAFVGLFMSAATDADDIKIFSFEERGRTQERGGTQSVLPDGSIDSSFRGISGLGYDPQSAALPPIFRPLGNNYPSMHLGQQLGDFPPGITRSAPPLAGLGGLDLSKSALPRETTVPDSTSMTVTSTNDVPAVTRRVPLYETVPGRIALASLVVLALFAAPFAWAAARKLAPRLWT